MKNLVLSAMIAVGASQAAGCIIVSDDTTTTGEGDLQVSWSLLSHTQAPPLSTVDNTVDTTGQCPAGSGTIRITAVREGDAPYVSDYLCSASGGPFTRLPVGTYTTWLEITDADGVTKFAESAEATVTVGDGTVTPVSFSLYTDRAVFVANWNLTRAGSPATCAQVGADKMSVLATVSGGSNGFDDDTNLCTAGVPPAVAFTQLPVPVGQSYTVVVSALNTAGDSIGDSAGIVNRQLTLGNSALDLGTVTVPIR